MNVDLSEWESLSSKLYEVIYVYEKTTPEQQALLNGNNPHQYPDEREYSEGKGTKRQYLSLFILLYYSKKSLNRFGSLCILDLRLSYSLSICSPKTFLL